MVTTSSGVPGRPAAFFQVRLLSSGQCFAMSVRNGPADSVLTRTLGAYSRANTVVSALSAAFAPA